jgi:hypothetical protein
MAPLWGDGDRVLEGVAVTCIAADHPSRCRPPVTPVLGIRFPEIDGTADHTVGRDAQLSGFCKAPGRRAKGGDWTLSGRSPEGDAAERELPPKDAPRATETVAWRPPPQRRKRGHYASHDQLSRRDG